MKAKLLGTEYNLVARPKLPKKGAGSVSLKVDGTLVDVKYTSNKGFCRVAADVLEYLWLTDKEGKFYFLTLDYGVAATSLAGKSITITAGTAARKDPERKASGREDRELARIDAFSKSWKNNRAEAPVAEPTAEGETEAAGEEATEE